MRRRSKGVLAVLGLAIVSALLAVGFLRAQSQEGTGRRLPVFEVASIKLNRSGPGFVNIMFKADGFSATNITLPVLIQNAYGVHGYQITGGPTWINSAAYDIDAKFDEAMARELQNLDPTQRILANQHMLQVLLADRFKFMAHFGPKNLPGYALVVAKNGPKLRETDPNNANGRPGIHGTARIGYGDLTGQAVTVANLADALSERLGEGVLDKTWLTTRYDFSLQWSSDISNPMPKAAGSPARNDSGPSIFTALEEQLGLRLESQQDVSSMLLIDHIEEPSPN